MGAAEYWGYFSIETREVIEGKGKDQKTRYEKVMVPGPDGLNGYMRRAAEFDMKTFLGLVRALLPHEVTVSPPKQKVVYQTPEEARDALIARGIPVLPDDFWDLGLPPLKPRKMIDVTPSRKKENVN